MSDPDILARLLGGPPQYDREHTTAQAEVDLAVARKFWRALGFPDAGEANHIFTDADVEALEQVTRALAVEGVDEQAVLALVRSIGRNMGRMAAWQVQTIDLALQRDGSNTSPASATRSAQRLLDVVGEFDQIFAPLLMYAWRRHMAAELGRHPGFAATSSAEQYVRQTVGFADLVAFTTAIKKLPPSDIADIVERFETNASDIVIRYGGRIVKTVGDEIFFAADAADQGAVIATTIARYVSAAPDLPRLRVGVATGAVVTRLGDLYGPTVNLASRLRAAASPGQCLVDQATASDITPGGKVQLGDRLTKELDGFGVVRCVAIHRAEAATAGNRRAGAGTPGQVSAPDPVQ